MTNTELIVGLAQTIAYLGAAWWLLFRAPKCAWYQRMLDRWGRTDARGRVGR